MKFTGILYRLVALPLVHSAWLTALGFTTFNALVLTVRIRTENKALGYT
jgi:methyltransferase